MKRKKVLSVFVDESGRFKYPDPESHYYIVGLVFHDEYCIANIGFVFLVMSVVLLCLLDKLTVNRVLLLELCSNNNGFIHFVAYNYTLSCLS